MNHCSNDIIRKRENFMQRIRLKNKKTIITIFIQMKFENFNNWINYLIALLRAHSILHKFNLFLSQLFSISFTCFTLLLLLISSRLVKLKNNFSIIWWRVSWQIKWKPRKKMREIRNRCQKKWRKVSCEQMKRSIILFYF